MGRFMGQGVRFLGVALVPLAVGVLWCELACGQAQPEGMPPPDVNAAGGESRRTESQPQEGSLSWIPEAELLRQSYCNAFREIVAYLYWGFGIIVGVCVIITFLLIYCPEKSSTIEPSDAGTDKKRIASAAHSRALYYKFHNRGSPSKRRRI